MNNPKCARCIKPVDEFDMQGDRDVVYRENALVEERVGLRASKPRGAKFAEDMTVLTGGH